ncbi:metallophosphoesterase [Brevibacillus daliensis]|uniref:metallophosphoesterase n=1 Tax=Brevibacillus daliensis TaxID=2892995 RepID=UPI001E63A8B4|nr:metallophosphoesterase [Brevibacillus daliensis]
MIKALKRIVFSFVVVCMLLAGIFFYAYKIEPNAITVTNQDIRSEYLPEGFHGKKIVQFSDTHLGSDYSLEQLQELVDKMNAINPDIVVFTGDLIDNFAQYSSEREQVQSILAKIHAPLGKYAVFGNHDRGGGASRFYKAYMEKAGFTVLVNETDKIELENGDRITIAGLDDFLLGKPNIENTLRKLNAKEFNLLMVHEPDVVEEVLSFPVDLQLSGHSHGGQVQLPFIGALYTPPLAEKYVEGHYFLSGTHKRLQLYVNRGIGTTRAPYRLGSKPELSIFTLQGM